MKYNFCRDKECDAEFESGTHLAIGDGESNFPKLLKRFRNHPDLYGVLEIKSGNEGIKNSLRALRNMALEVEKV